MYSAKKSSGHPLYWAACRRWRQSSNKSRHEAENKDLNLIWILMFLLLLMVPTIQWCSTWRTCLCNIFHALIIFACCITQPRDAAETWNYPALPSRCLRSTTVLLWRGFCSLTRFPAQTWSVSQTPTTEPANSPLTSTSLSKSWTCGSLPQRAAVSVCGGWRALANVSGIWRALTDSDVSPLTERAVYNLYAVSNHTGNALGGHYTAYCRNPALGEWYSYNDSRYQVRSTQLLSCYLIRYLMRLAVKLCSIIIFYCMYLL